MLRLRFLFKKYIHGDITEDEYQELFDLIEDDDHEELEAFLHELALEAPADNDYNPRDWERIIDSILNAPKAPEVIEHKRLIPFRKFLKYAAIFILFIGLGGYCWMKSMPEQAEVIVEQKSTNNIIPGGNKAILTLGNGAKIVLNTAQNGSLARQGNAQVIKLTAGQLSYKHNAGNDTLSRQEIVYNTLTTPRGGQYQILLPDSSKVWLNAASSLRFPTAFNGEERTVELSGEAYFEVARNKKQPFVVNVVPEVGGSSLEKVKVLGTHFDIMAYKDEPVLKTTLLKGLVKISKGDDYTFLKPGQQAQITQRQTEASNKITVAKGVDTDTPVAWKNGFFQFDDNDIAAVMRQISRWYNVDVIYKGKVSSHFVGTISRNSKVSEVLKMLEMTGAVHFEIDGRSIIVLS